MSDSVGSVVSAEERLQQITRVTDTALAHLDFDALLRELLQRVQELLGVDTAAVQLYDHRRAQLVATAAVGVEEEVRQGVTVPLGQGFVGTIAARKAAHSLEQLDRTSVFNPLLVDKGISSLLGVPMLASDDLIGVLHVGTFKPRQFTEHEQHLLQLAADRIALTTEANISRTDRTTAAALQRSLLPPKLPTISQASIAARYVPGEGGKIGGDWYDVFTLPTGRIGMVIGDVVGHGLDAAVVMGRLRSALRAYALETEDPALALEKLDRKATHFETNTMATVAYAILEPSANRLTLSLGGHPPPVQVLPGKQAALVEFEPPDPPVGLGISEGPRKTTSVELPPGSALCFYTDGLMERRGETLDAGLARLCDATTAAPAESICATVMGELVGSDPVDDDIALLVLSRTS